MNGWTWTLMVLILISLVGRPFAVGDVRTTGGQAFGAASDIFIGFVILKAVGVL